MQTSPFRRLAPSLAAQFRRNQNLISSFSSSSSSSSILHHATSSSSSPDVEPVHITENCVHPGPFDLVGTIVYEIDQHPYQNTFYNVTIEVVEPGVSFSMESVFLFTLGIALLILLGLWINGQIQNLYKKTKRSSKVEVGTKTTDASMDEWLQGTAYTQSTSSKSKKK